MPAVGGVAEVLVTASIPTCGWRPASTVPWLEPIGLEQRVGSGPLRFLVAPQLESLLPRTGTVILESASVSVSQAADVDADQNNLYDGWTAFFGLDTLPAADGGPNGDPDGDGQTNRMEHDLGTHPRGAMRRYFAEGVSNAFFDTELALFVPGSQPGRAVVRIQQQNAIERIVYVSAATPHPPDRFGRAAQIADGRAVRHGRRIGRAGRGRSDGPLGCHRVWRACRERHPGAGHGVVSRRRIDGGRFRALLPPAEPG